MQSRRIRDAVKNARTDFLQSATTRIADIQNGPLASFFDPSAVLVPAPRSSPLVVGGLWPGDRIARELVNVGLGAAAEPLLKRITSVPKSAFARPGQRPTVERHMETIEVELALGEPPRIIVVDDVVTKGTMLFSCVDLLRGAFPDADVRGFALLRTMGLIAEVTEYIDPCVGTITVNDWGNVNRDP